MTKLRKNDYQELRKGGIAAIDVKILELLADYGKTKMLKMKNELKNLREGAVTRLAIAKLKTIRAELKETK
jgi:ribosomal protein L29